MGFFAMPLTGILVVVCVCVWLHQHSSSPTLHKRLASPAAVICVTVLAAMCACCAYGLYESDPWILALLSVLACAYSIICLFRFEIVSVLSSRIGLRSQAARSACTALTLLAISFAAFFALESPWNEALIGAWSTFRLGGILLIFMLVSSLYLFWPTRSIANTCVIVALAIVGLIQYFIAQFKGTAILPADLFALRTAIAVSGKYTYSLNTFALGGLCAVCVGVTLVALLAEASSPTTSTDQNTMASSDRQKRFAQLIAAASCLVTLVAFIAVPNYVDDFGLQLAYFGHDALKSYQDNGFLPSFIAAFQNVGIKQPDDYSADATERDVEELSKSYDTEVDNGRLAAVAQYEAIKPSLVVVMNETFADLSEFEILRSAGYDGPAFFKSVDDALLRGNVAVSVLGGGTSNTEFEFLTGTNCAFVGEGKYPYVMYSFANVDNLAKQLSELGYTCSALHPNLASNWNRDVVYADLGFDRFFSIDDFAGAPELHSGVSDEATYDKVLELLNDTSDPQFIFDVTMQNHSGYDQHNMPTKLLRHYAVDLYADDAWVSDAIDEYLACIEASDQALNKLMEQLAALDRPVILVFFGDHHPHISEWINDDYYVNEDELTHQLRIHHTGYFIWANYDVAGREQKSDVDDMSVDILGTTTLELMGAPLTKMERARLVMRKDLLALNVFGYQGADRAWYQLDDDGPYSEIYNKLKRINYYSFGSKI